MLLCGCDKQEKIVPVLNGFDCEFSVSDSDFSGELSVLENNDCILKFNSPTELFGTTFVVKNNTLSVESNGYKADFKTEDMSFDSFAVDLQKSLAGIADENDIEIIFNNLGFPTEIKSLSKNEVIYLKNHIKH